MASEWYCYIAGREIGPLSPQQLKAMADKGQIMPNDCVRRGTEGEWVIARQIPGLLGGAVPPVAAPPVVGAERQVEPQAPPVAPPKEPVTDDPPAIRINIEAPPVERNPVAARAKRQREQQARMIGVLLGSILLMGVVALYISYSGGDEKHGLSGLTEQKTNKELKKPKPKKPVHQTPEVLEKQEGVIPLDKPVETEQHDISELLGMEKEKPADRPEATDDKPVDNKDAVSGPSAEPKPEVKKNPLLDHKWIDAATSAVMVKYVSVRIISAELAPPLERADSRRILITVAVRNSGMRDVDFQGWTRGGVARDAKLFDTSGEPLAAKAVGRAPLPGQDPPMSLPHGGVGKERLAFEAPPEGAEYVLLEMPAAAFGIEATIRLRIPAAMIVARQSEQPPENPREPQSPTPESDFGLPEVDEAIE